MNVPGSLFDIGGVGLWLLIFAAVLLLILVISFRSRAVVFCQYLKAMTGVELKPAEVRRVFKGRGREGVRELFLDLIIREDLKSGPIDPESTISRKKHPTSSGRPLPES